MHYQMAIILFRFSLVFTFLRDPCQVWKPSFHLPLRNTLNSSTDVISVVKYNVVAIEIWKSQKIWVYTKFLEFSTISWYGYAFVSWKNNLLGKRIFFTFTPTFASFTNSMIKFGETFSKRRIQSFTYSCPRNFLWPLFTVYVSSRKKI